MGIQVLTYLCTSQESRHSTAELYLICTSNWQFERFRRV